SAERLIAGEVFRLREDPHRHEVAVLWFLQDGERRCAELAGEPAAARRAAIASARIEDGVARPDVADGGEEPGIGSETFAGWNRRGAAERQGGVGGAGHPQIEVPLA